MLKFRKLFSSLLLPSVLAGTLTFSPAAGEELELVLQAGHQSGVSDALWLDNRHIMSASLDGSVKIWDTEDRRVKRTLWHPSPSDRALSVKDLIPTNEGTWALYEDFSLVLWSDDGKALKVSKPEIKERGADPQACAGKSGRLYFYGSYSPTFLWDPSTNEVADTNLEKSTEHLAVSPDEKVIAAEQASRVILQRGETRETLPETYSNRWGIDDLLFSEDSNVLYVATTVNWVEAWRLSDKTLMFQVPIDKNAPSKEALQQSGYSSQDLGLSMVDLNSEQLVVQTTSGSLFTLDKKNGDKAPLSQFSVYGINQIEVSPDGKRFAGSYDSRATAAVPVLQQTGDSWESLELGGRSVYAYDLATQDDKLFMGSFTQAVLSLDLKSGQPHRSYPTGYFAHFTTGPNRLYCGGNDGVVHAYNIATGQELWQRDLTSQSARYGFGPQAMAIDRSGRQLAVSISDKQNRIELLDPSTGKSNETLPMGNSSASRQLLFSDDGRKLFYARGRTIHLFDIDYHKQIHSWKLKGSRIAPIVGLVSHPLSQAIVVLDRDGQLATIDPSRLDTEPTYTEIRGLPNINSMTVEGSKLLLAAGRRSYLADLNGKVLKTFGGHSSDVSDVLRIGNSVISTGWDARIHFWNKDSGEAQASLVNLDQGTEWLVTTPSYYFDGSENAQDLIEWRWNGELFKVSRFFEKFYQPGLLARIVQSGDPVAGSATSPPAALGDMPPKVTLLEPKPLGNGEYEVYVKVEDTSSEVGEVRLYHNGHRVPGQPPYKIKALEGDNRLRASAFNSDKTVESSPSRLTFVSDVPPQPTTLHIFAAAVNDYPNPLDFAVPDAKSFTQAFKPGLYDKINRVTLLDKEASKAGIVEALQKIDCQPQDTLLVFLAGHGTIIDDKFHYLPYGSDGEKSALALSSRELGDILSHLPATRQVLFLDTCHAGASAKDLADLLVEKKEPMVSSARGASFVRDQKLLARRAGTFLVAGSTPEATAAEVPELGHGIFTYAVLEGLKEESSSADQQITVNELLRYLNEAVPELSMKFRGSPHGIWQFSAGQDFPIAKP